MIFECHYCPEVSKNLIEAIRHFEQDHRNKDEYIELAITEDMIEPVEERKTDR